MSLSLLTHGTRLRRPARAPAVTSRGPIDPPRPRGPRRGPGAARGRSLGRNARRSCDCSLCYSPVFANSPSAKLLSQKKQVLYSTISLEIDSQKMCDTCHLINATDDLCSRFLYIITRVL